MTLSKLQGSQDSQASGGGVLTEEGPEAARLLLLCSSQLRLDILRLPLVSTHCQTLQPEATEAMSADPRRGPSCWQGDRQRRDTRSNEPEHTSVHSLPSFAQL